LAVGRSRQAEAEKFNQHIRVSALVKFITMQPQATGIDQVENLSDVTETPDVSGLPENTNEFDEFRRLVLSEEQGKIAELETQVISLQLQLDSIPPASAQEVSDVLPAAIKQSSDTNNKLARSTLPVVEENIRQSVKENPQILAEALFPAIGPAIRKAIAEALGTMIQSLNQTIEYSFSPQSIKWRIEALQTGKPFAEVVLLKTLLYRVEQIFLIHRETGLLLQHVTANANNEQDADMVSAMLTAIQDFVKDSFMNSPEATLDTLQVGELAVWIERSGNLLFAAVIRGNAPLAVREEFQNAIEQIEAEHETDFAKFQGDSEPFERSRPILEDCLKYQTGDKSNKKKTLFSPFNLIGAILLLTICAVGFFLGRDYWRWSSYVSDLKNRVGIVVTDSHHGWFKNSIQGLRDPLAANPTEIIGDYNLVADDVQSNWEEYQSSNAEIVLTRAKKILNPPPTVLLTFEKGILIADGAATADWFEKAKQLSGILVGVKEFKTTQNTTDLQSKIENKTVNFACNTTDLPANQTQNIKEIGESLQTLSVLAKEAKKTLRIEVEGSSDLSGTSELNSKISQIRAEKVATALIATFPSLKNTEIKAVGLGTTGNIGCKVKFKLNLE
jgi:outer membrane protein OmpA-like peptidoglycan-associated protein